MQACENQTHLQLHDNEIIRNGLTLSQIIGLSIAQYHPLRLEGTTCAGSLTESGNLRKESMDGTTERQLSRCIKGSLAHCPAF